MAPRSVILRIFDKRHNLKAATIGEDWALPFDEIMQAAKGRHFFSAGAQHQMIGVAENDVGSGFLHLIEVEAFDGAYGSHRHESRCANVAAPGVNRSAPCGTIGFV